MSAIGHSQKLKCVTAKCGRTRPYWSDHCARCRKQSLGYSTPNKPKSIAPGALNVKNAPTRRTPDLQSAPNSFSLPFVPKPKSVLIPEVVSAAMGAQTFKKATCDLSPDDRKTLTRLLKPDVDTWRADFATKLREAATDALADLHAAIPDIPPAAKAYTLAVLVDKAAAMEGRYSLQGAQVNVQINNFSGQTPKNDLLDAITGKSPLTSTLTPSDVQIAS